MAKAAKRKGGNKPPISAHPAFPAIVALWFAALFGIGSLVLPNVLLEKLSLALGLPALISAAAPPIGFTAKLVIAALAASLGVLAGLFISRKVVASQSSAPRQPASRSKRHFSEAPAKKPIFATEELGEEGLGPVIEDDDDYEDEVFEEAPTAKPALPGRRRALSVTDDSGPSDYLATVPVPGEADPYSQQDAPSAFESDTGSPPLETLDLGGFAGEDTGNETERDVSTPEPMSSIPGDSHAGDQSARSFDAPKAEGRPFDAPRAPDTDATPGGADVAVGSGEPPRPHFGLRLGMPSEVLSGTNEPEHNAIEPDVTEPPRQIFGAPQDEPMPFAGPAADQADFSAPPAAATSPFANPAHASNGLEFSAPSAANAGPLADLSMSDLIERFTRSMQEANVEPGLPSAPSAQEEAPVAASETGADEAAAAVPFAFQPAPLESAAEETEEAFAAPDFSAPTFASASEQVDEERSHEAVPAALRPLDLGAFEDDEEDDDDPFANDFGFGRPATAPGQLFARPAANEPPAAAEPESTPELAASFAPPAEEEDGDTGNDEGYSSLLSMKSPLGMQREFVRVEDEDDAGDSLGSDAPEPVVVFPGQEGGKQAAGNQPRPFDAPPAGPNGGLMRASPTTPAQKPVDPAETERALREALEKLQRMSGAA
ncbi:hypothetical protein [Parerythrobacter aestuarii]|uniref:hypothetical protein n=1 Tax=Parerythrobacter aestuarii TaxID=3020909 RepID=UPI0024DE6410|nr:hypothetical protein [Parerythrobacter aestuarii]